MGLNLGKKANCIGKVKYNSYGVKILVMRQKKKYEIKITIFSTP